MSANYDDRTGVYKFISTDNVPAADVNVFLKYVPGDRITIRNK